MDLFDLPDKKKEILEDGTVVVNLKSNGKYIVKVKDNIMTVEPKGFMNAFNVGLVGEKTYNLDTITGVQLKEPGWTTGYFTILTAGTTDLKGGVKKAVNDEDTITFLKDETHLIHQLKEYIENYIANRNKPQQVVVQPQQTAQSQQMNNLEQLKLLKELLDMGALTQEEFDDQKKKLLL